MRFKPASFNAFAFAVNAEPLVVSAISMPGKASTSIAINRSIPLRNNGSPPVKRIFSTPSPCAILATRTISSNVSNSSCGRN